MNIIVSIIAFASWFFPSGMRYCTEGNIAEEEQFEETVRNPEGPTGTHILCK